MSLGTKTLLGLGSAFAMWSLLLYAAIAALLRDGHAALERQTIEHDCHRARSLLQQVVETLASKCGDWAQWDDTYRFVDDRNDKFVQENVTAGALATLNIDFLAFVDRDWQVVYAAAHTPGSDSLSPPPSQLATMLATDSPLRRPTAKDHALGLVMASGQPFVIACLPILHGDRSGPANGRLLFGKVLDSQLVARLAEIAHSELCFEPLAAPAPACSVVPIDEDTVEGRFVVDDFTGHPALLGKLRAPRSIYAQGEQSLRLLLLALMCSGGIGLGVALWGIHRIVLDRLSRVRGALLELTRTGDLTRRAPVEGCDEVSEVARALNSMIRRMHRTQRQLIRANDSRSRFLANVSHEVRTPVNAMLGFAELLNGVEVSPEQRFEYAATIRRNGKHMLAMLNDLLDTAKAESGQMSVEHIAVDLPALLVDVIACLRQSADDKGLRLRGELRTPIPVTIHSDPTRLRQILTNLLANAIKFTSVGEVCLEVSMPDGRHLQFAVTDTGIGIPPDQQARLFVPFAQADTSTTRRFGGTGLGLALSRQLARLLGGDVTCSSAAGVGSTFTATITAEATDSAVMVHQLPSPSTAAAAPAPSKATPGDALRGRRILVADDAPDNLRLVSLMLRKHGAEVQTACDGLGAIAAVLEGQSCGAPIDLVLMDMQMPVLDGCEATMILRERGYTAPIIALTASAMQSDRDRCMRAGCNDYLSKPIDRAALLGHVGAAIEVVGTVSAS